MNEWKALTGRVSLLTAAPWAILPSAVELYGRLWTDEPENFQRNANPLLPSVAQGKFAGLAVACSVLPTRIDFALTAVVTPDQFTQLALQVIEDTKALYDELGRIANALSTKEISGAVNRVAIFVQYVKLRPGFADANRETMLVIPQPYRIKLTDEEGFVLQVNRPRSVPHVENIKMNFLTKWSVEQFQVMTLAVPAEGLTMPPVAGIATPKVEQFIGGAVSFDYNSVPTPQPLTGQQQSLLLGEGLKQALQDQQVFGLSAKGTNGG